MPGEAGLYPEYVAQSYTSLYNHSKYAEKAIFDKRSKALDKAIGLNTKLQKSHGKPFCLKGISVGYCPEGSVIYKPIYCGKESCDFCGQDRSPAHYRRINSALPTVKKWNSLTYLVITIPDTIRGEYYDKKKLNEFRTFIRRKLKKDGFTQAVLRWHWAGSCKVCKNNPNLVKFCLECNGTGCGSELEPHLNILLPAGNTDTVKCYTPGRYDMLKSYLSEWRESLVKWFKKKHKGKEVTTGNIWHGFIPPVGTAVKTREGIYRPLTQKIFDKKVRHRLRYIFRATLRHPELVNSYELILKKYINTSRIGQWEEEPVQAKVCHCCGGEVKWYNDRAETFWNNFHTLVEIEPGIYFRNYLKDEESG